MKRKLAEFITVISGMRKTIIMLILVVIGIIFRVKGYLDGSQLVDLLKNTVIAFFSANSIEHVGSTIKEYLTSKNSVSTAPEENTEIEPVVEN